MASLLEEYLDRNNMSEERAIAILEGVDESYVEKNDFYFEIEGDTAYIEAKSTKKKLEIIEVNLEVGYIEVKIV